MAVGDFLVYKNNLDTSVLPNAGGSLTTLWDTEDKSHGSSIPYNNGTFTLLPGTYLIMYSEKFATTNTSDNERITATGSINIFDGISTTKYGHSGGYIRKYSGQMSMSLSGYVIYNVSSSYADISVEFERVDNSTSGTVNRVPNAGGVQIVQLDTSHNFASYLTTADESTAGTTERTLNLTWSAVQDTGFSRSGSSVTVTNAGRYLVTYSMSISRTGTHREDVVGYLRRNGTTEVVGSNSYCYLRGLDASQAGALTWIGVVNVGAGDSFDVRWQAPQSATITAKSAASLQFWQLPSGSKSAIVEATTGNYNGVSEFAWDTTAYIDTDQYTHTNGTSNIDIDSNDFTLAFATFHQNAPDTVQRGYPQIQFKVDGNVDDTATGGVYHRNSGGSGIVAVTNASILQTRVGSSIEVTSEATGVSGDMINDGGQFAVISLTEALGASYVFPPSISNALDLVDVGDTNLVITGNSFGVTQGTGKVEIGDSTDYTTATLVTQSIDTWSDASIQFDVDLTGFVKGSLYFYVTNDNGGISTPFTTNYGIPSYEAIVTGLNPDIFHTFQNTYVDTQGVAAANSQASTGSFGFVTIPLTRGATHSWTCNNNNSRIEMNDTIYTNITTRHTQRLIGGWIQLGQVYLVPSGFYDEGGQLNNLYMVVGFGNVLLGNISDSYGSPAFKVQVYSDFKLSTNRPYHVMIKFIGGTGFTMFVDGVEVSKTNGNPITNKTMSTHSGDWVYGKPDGSLDTGGTDIQYPSAPDLLISHFGTWSGLSATFPTDSEIRTELFEKGAIATDLITSDTEANMQLAVDALANTDYVDKPLPLKINKSSDGNFRIELDHITFDDRCSMHVQYTGNTTLTIVNNGTSNCDLSKCSTPYGGTIVIENPATFTIDGLITGSIVEIYDNEIVDVGNRNTKLAFANNSGTSFQYSHNGTSNDVIVAVLKSGYKEIKLLYTLGSNNQTLTVVPEVDFNG